MEESIPRNNLRIFIRLKVGQTLLRKQPRSLWVSADGTHLSLVGLLEG